MPEEIAEHTSLQDPNFIPNDQLRASLEETGASAEQVEEFVSLNTDARLRALQLGLLILSGVSALAILPATRLPDYRPGEIPDPAPTSGD